MQLHTFKYRQHRAGFLWFCVCGDLMTTCFSLECSSVVSFLVPALTNVSCFCLPSGIGRSSTQFIRTLHKLANWPTQPESIIRNYTNKRAKMCSKTTEIKDSNFGTWIFYHDILMLWAESFDLTWVTSFDCWITTLTSQTFLSKENGHQYRA